MPESIASWWFPTDEAGREQLKDPLEGLFSGRSELDSVDILVREALQNSLDALGGAEGPALVRFRVRSLRGVEKENLLAALQFDVLGRHVDASNAELEGQSSQYADPSRIRCEAAITALYIEDFGTQGLVGREFKGRQSGGEGGIPDCFLGLCRSVGRNDKGAAGSGGTYGFGKGVYWAASSLGTVLFHSRLRTPWVPGSDAVSGGESCNSVEERLFGVARLVSHTVDGENKQPDGYYCADRLPGLGPRSLWNDAASRVAEELGMTQRGPGESGTSILVVPARDPHPDSCRSVLLDDPADLAESIRVAAAHYFWPAMLRGKLEVQVEHDRSAVEPVDPWQFQELAPFLEAFDKAAAPGGAGPVVTKTKQVEVPKWELLGIKKQAADFTISVRATEEPVKLESVENGPGRNRIALVRGALMVVGYMETRRRAAAAKAFHAVVVAGLAHGKSEGDGALEKLLQRAETITHDQWDHKSDQLKGWHGAQARVKQVLDMVRTAVKEVTEKADQLSGEGPSTLRKLLSLDASGKPTSAERFGRVEFAKPVEHLRDASGAWVAREVEVRFPKSTDANVRPAKARVVASIGIRDKEGASKRANDEKVQTFVESFQVRGIDPGAVTSDLREDGSAVAIVDFGESRKEVVLTARIRSEAMDFGRFARRSFDFRILVERPTEKVVTDG